MFGSIGSAGIVRDLGLPDLKIEGANNSGALAGTNAGTVIGSYATGEIEGNSRVGGLIGESQNGVVMNSRANVLIRASENDIGGLVGRNTGAAAVIINSYASGAISGVDWLGGLSGANDGKIINSYASGAISGSGATIGGLAGSNSRGSSEVINSYATGTVSWSGTSGADRIGNLLGFVANNAKVINSYAIGTVTGATDATIGAFIGRHEGSAGDIARDVSHSYWNSETTEQSRSSGGRGQTTAQLQMPTTASGIYANWSVNNWDFGSSSQYPVLKYAPNPDSSGVPTCDGNGLPDCGDLITPQLRYGLSMLTLAGDDQLSPPFRAEIEYRGLAISTDTAIRLIPTALDANAEITIYRDDGETESQIGSAFASGTPSREIILDQDRINIIVIEIDPSDAGAPTVRYSLYLRYKALHMIDSLEDLYNIRNNLDDAYRLTRNLDFADDASYDDAAANKAAYTVDDFNSASDTGWMPIPNFSGNFNGNGYTITNLQINRAADSQSLFGSIGSDGIVRDLGLSDLKIEGANNSSALAGTNAGTVISSYAVGEIDGNNKVGGLIGESQNGVVMNSRANVLIRASGNDIGGLVGRNTGAAAVIINSHASGAISGVSWVGGLTGRNDGKIINSYATGTVSGSGQTIGGLAGSNSMGSSEVRNSYATGAVQIPTSADRTGSLLGFVENNAKVINSYAIGTVTSISSAFIGALIGRHAGNISDIARDVTNSYWNSETVGQSRSSGGSGQTTAQLQMPTSATGIYANWSVNNWDFGSAMQYPVLKYAPNPNSSGVLTCDGIGLPDCGTLISPQIRYRLIALTLAGEDRLFPPFRAEIEYRGLVISTDTAIRLIPTASDANAEITIYRDDGETESQIGNAFASGTPSSEIILDQDRINIIVIEIDPSDAGIPTVRHSLHLRYEALQMIDSLEDLYNIRNKLDGGYSLTRNLDFADDTSYADATANKAAYTVDDFDDDSDSGWEPIGSFIGNFNGNGYTISNLQINRNANNQSLFGSIGSSGIVRDLGLPDLKIEGANNSGALAGTNAGTVIGSYAVGEIDGNNKVGGLIGESQNGVVMNSRANVLIRASGNDIGGLVGRNTGAAAVIINSYASGAISGAGWVGGLTGTNDSKIISSYAIGNVAGRSRAIGGLVGSNSRASSEIINSYATGTVQISSSALRTGSFLGEMSNNAKVINSYAIGNVTGATGATIGALIGRHPGNANNIARDVTNSYWNSETAGQSRSAGGSGRTTVQLQMPTTATGIYANWSVNNWDFGSAMQYPVLKYAPNPNSSGVPTCDGNGLPDCGDLITPQLRYGLSMLTLAGDDQLSPPFRAEIEYRGLVISTDTAIRLIPTALDANAEIIIYRDDGETESQIGNAFASGTPSREIILDGINIIVIEIDPSDAGIPTVRYTLHLRYLKPTIDSLEDLYNIRNNLDGEYSLTRNLDFADDASYADSAANKAAYTVDDFNSASDTGWVPIPNFSGTFNGNGYTISNLQINRIANNQGLFGSIGSGGTVRDLGLLNLKIESFGGNDFIVGTGALAGTNFGTVIGSYAAGEISGTFRVGGLIGESRGLVVNSHANVLIRSSEDDSGGLVGRNTGMIINSHASGAISGGSWSGGLVGRNTGRVINSYATGNVTSNGGRVGGLVGENAASSSEIRNSYATGIVQSTFGVVGAAIRFGGLVGEMANNSRVINSYAIGTVVDNDANFVGALIGNHLGNASNIARDVSHSYWNSETAGQPVSAGGSGQTTAQLQSPTTATGIYANWSVNNWDFGSPLQYPVLKYAQNPGGGSRGLAMATACPIAAHRYQEQP